MQVWAVWDTGAGWWLKYLIWWLWSTADESNTKPHQPSDIYIRRSMAGMYCMLEWLIMLAQDVTTLIMNTANTSGTQYNYVYMHEFVAWRPYPLQCTPGVGYVQASQKSIMYSILQVHYTFAPAGWSSASSQKWILFSCSTITVSYVLYRYCEHRKKEWPLALKCLTRTHLQTTICWTVPTIFSPDVLASLTLPQVRFCALLWPWNGEWAFALNGICCC